MRRVFLAPILCGFMTLAGCAGVGVSYYSRTPPPPLRVETYGVAPGPGYVWTNGYWGWQRNNYVWVPGRWTRPPRARAVWVEPRWESRSGRYYFRPGHWR